MSFSVASSFLGVPARVVWTEISGGKQTTDFDHDELPSEHMNKRRSRRYD